MSMSDEGTVTDEVRIRELEQALETETDRLRKLYAAYEQQEKELVDAKAEIEKLQKAYEELDKRSKLILKLVLVLSGLDIFLAL